MPELPEVETIRRQLARLIVGKTISSIEVLNPGSFRADKDSLIGKRIAGVGRKGKVLILDLKGGLQLFVHLKMSGRLEFKDEGQGPKAKGEKHKHLRVVIGFDDGGYLLFHDQRKFGWITDDPAALPPGVDALDSSLTENKLTQILGSSSGPIKQILLDQSKIAGIGNIYVSEILWQAGISPFRKGVSLLRQGDSLSETSEKFAKLLTAIRKILIDAIKSGGSTMDDGLYQQVGGEAGDYWSRRRVYDRAGEPCRRLACRRKHSLIQKITIGNRSTYFCPSCQIT